MGPNSADAKPSRDSWLPPAGEAPPEDPAGGALPEAPFCAILNHLKAKKHVAVSETVGW